jgi:hypothetical protein
MRICVLRILQGVTNDDILLRWQPSCWRGEYSTKVADVTLPEGVRTLAAYQCRIRVTALLSEVYPGVRQPAHSLCSF